MKRLVIFLILGAFCLVAGANDEVKRLGGKGKTSSWALPAPQCKAIEQYIAKIDAARSIREKAQREEKYAEAQAELKEALKDREDPALLAQASEYAKRTERVASSESTDVKLSEILDKRLKLRSALLERCMDFTPTR